jgi:peroxiredoxin
MSLTISNVFQLGAKAPDFTLLNVVSNQLESLNTLKGTQGTVVLFICNHCPFVIHINAALVKMANEYRKKGIHFIAISSNDVDNYPQDHPTLMKKVAAKENYPFSYLYDETQEVAKAYKASCTPDIYLFDAHLKAIYHGQLDASRPGNGMPVSGADLTSAINQLLENKAPLENQKPSMGCNIKWKS